MNRRPWRGNAGHWPPRMIQAPGRNSSEGFVTMFEGWLQRTAEHLAAVCEAADRLGMRSQAHVAWRRWASCKKGRRELVSGLTFPGRRGCHLPPEFMLSGRSETYSRCALGCWLRIFRCTRKFGIYLWLHEVARSLLDGVLGIS